MCIVTMGLLTLAACGGQGKESASGDPEGMPAAAQPMSADVQSFVNQGNDAQRSGEYEAALAFYQQGMELAPEHPVPQFGALMAAMALGEEALADSLSDMLAVGFIFTVHFFNTHFRPDKFPMDPVIFTGRVSVDELKVDKPREYEELVASGELERNLFEPYPRNVQILFRVIGFTALSIGLTLIFLIVYSMLWGYR